MNLEDTIIQALQYYPLIFKTRIDVLHHLFYVNGNGYGWRDGELVDVCDSFKGRKQKISDHEAVRRSKECFFAFGVQYPLSEYSKINTMPSNVKPDWKKGAEEIRQYFEQAYDEGGGSNG